MLFFSAIYGHLTSAQVPWPFSSMGKDEPANICALYELSHGRRPPGRTHTSFSSQVRECIDPNKHFSGNDIVCTAQDRASWRRLTADFSSVNRCLWRCCSEITLVSDQLFNTNIVKPGFKCDRSSVMKSSSKWLRPLCESSAGFFTLFLLSCKRPREATAQESSAHWVSVRPNTSSTTGSL